MKEENADILNRYFSALQEEEPLVPLEEIRNLLHEKTPGKKRLPKPFFKTLNFWIMSSLIVILSTALFYLVFLNEKAQQQNTANVIEQEQQETLVSSQQPKPQEGFQIKERRLTQEELEAERSKRDSSKSNTSIENTAQQLDLEKNPVNTNNPEISKENLQPLKGSSSAEPQNEFQQKVNITGIPLLQLSPEDLGKLGIETYNKEIYFASTSWPMISAFYPEGSAHWMFSQKNEVLKNLSYIDSNHLPSMTPIFISDYLGATTFYAIDPELVEKEMQESLVEYSKEKDNWKERYDLLNRYYSRKINSYLGILVHSGADPLPPDSNGYHPDFIFWYEVNEDLLKVLPEDVAQKVRQDYSSLFSPEVFITGKSSKATPSSQTCTYFEACKNRKGVLQELFVNPNPFTDHTILTLSSTAERKITIQVYSIQGKLIATVHKDVLQPKGEKDYELRLPTAAEGIYLISVTTDHGEVLTQRLIKQK